ncbi:MAG: Uma2 family endonuclease [Bacteroidia bacterium]|nr:Uma2 family endonuclease [Bacteroidia bacterium]
METVVLKFTPQTRFTDDELFEFCQANRDLRIERNQKGELVIMSPVGGRTSSIHFIINGELYQWYLLHRNAGILFDATAAFKLPDNSVLGPDAAFVSIEKWRRLSAQEQQKFPPITPDFVIEIRSASDSITQQMNKMDQWIRNGCRLAWLIDPADQKAYIYHPDGAMVTVNSFSQTLSASPILPGFELALSLLIQE